MVINYPIQINYTYGVEVTQNLFHKNSEACHDVELDEKTMYTLQMNFFFMPTFTTTKINISFNFRY